MMSPPTKFNSETARLYSGSRLTPALATIKTQPTERAITTASVTRRTGGLSTMTKSNLEPKSEKTAAALSDASSSAGFGGVRPDETMLSPGKVLDCTAESRGTEPDRQSVKPTSDVSPRRVDTDGRRRSASTSRTECPPSARTVAKAIAVVVLPSFSTALVTTKRFGGESTRTKVKFVRILRNDSQNDDCKNAIPRDGNNSISASAATGTEPKIELSPRATKSSELRITTSKRETNNNTATAKAKPIAPPISTDLATCGDTGDGSTVAGLTTESRASGGPPAAGRSRSATPTTIASDSPPTSLRARPGSALSARMEISTVSGTAEALTIERASSTVRPRDSELMARSKTESDSIKLTYEATLC